MTTDRTRRIAAASIAVLAASTLAACGTGGGAATSQQYQPGIGANVREGDVQLYNALLVAGSDETLALSAGIVNRTEEDQTLESATFGPRGDSDVEEVTVEPSADVTVGPGQLYTIGELGELAGIESELTAGLYSTVTLTFSGAGAVTIEAPIVARDATYESVAEAPAGGATDEAAVADTEAAEG